MWEALGATLAVLGGPGVSALGQIMTFMFLGAVFACIGAVPSSLREEELPKNSTSCTSASTTTTHMSGRGPLGVWGPLLFVPATVTVGILWKVAFDKLLPLSGSSAAATRSEGTLLGHLLLGLPISSMVLGFRIAIKLSSHSRRPLTTHDASEESSVDKIEQL